MKFNVRFKIGNRLGAGSTYTLVEICVSLVNRYGLREREVTKIVQLKPGEKFSNAEMEITRQPMTRQEIADEQIAQHRQETQG